ncbi:tyrosine-type recombinase/integrase [bacterium]|nr:tyrosine-type recombinase/integrase [bacterium]
MNTYRLPQTHIDDSAWSQALYAFLAEKEQRSGSRRTVESYSRMLQDFFGRVAKTPDHITSPEVLAYAHGIGKSGRPPSAITIGARVACVSSFFKFLIRMGALSANPCDALERPKVQPSPARGYSADDVRRLLGAVPDTVAGRRDRAIILTLVLTARRRSEVINLKAGDITLEGETAFYSYRGKGGKRGRRELPRPAYDAIIATLSDCGKTLLGMHPEESLWQASAAERGVTSATFYARLRKYMVAAGLPPSGVHILRHTAAKLRREAGESIEAVSQFLDHSSLAVTTVYLRRLEGQQDGSWGKVAEAIGVAAVYDEL